MPAKSPQNATESVDVGGKTVLRFILTRNFGGRFLQKAYCIKGTSRPVRLNLETTGQQKPLRAMVILMMLAKLDGIAPTDKNGNIKYSENFTEETWITTLENFHHDGAAEWYENNFKCPPFIYATGGTAKDGGGLYPYAHFQTQSFSPNNLEFFVDATDENPTGNPLEDGELYKYAVALEEKGKWDNRIVPKLMHHLFPVAEKKKNAVFGIAKLTADERTSVIAFARDIAEGIVKSVRPHYDCTETIHRATKAFPFLLNAPLLETGETALHLALEFYNEKVVDDLLQTQNIDLNCKTDRGVTPLHLAARHNLMDIAEWLVNKGADPQARNYQGANVIYETAFGGGLIPLFEYFAKLGVPENVICVDGTTTLSVAIARQNQQEAIRYLTVAHKKSLDGEVAPLRPPKQIKSKKTNRREEVLKVMKLANLVGAKVDVPEIEIATVTEETKKLHVAAGNGNVEEIQDLVKSPKKLDLNFIDPDLGTTALHECAQNADFNGANALLKAGADPFVRDAHGRTPALLIPQRIVRRKGAESLKWYSQLYNSAKMWEFFRHYEFEYAHKLKINLFVD